MKKDNKDNIVILSGTPNEKQELFFKSKAKYTAYGGARGGGKSWAVRRKLLMMSFRYPGLKCLIIRRTLPELNENHVKPLKSELFGTKAVTYSESQKCFCFINGSIINLGYCDSEGDVLRYQGQEYDVIALDEATQLTEYQFNIFKACLRGANSSPKRIYITCNPGGIGHSWVKRLFIDREYRSGENSVDYKFIPASVYDNIVLLKNNPDYLSQLKSLPPDLREAWLYGKWNVFAGQYFKEFDYDLHTVEPMKPNEKATCYVAIDYGLDMFAAVFVAVDKDRNAYVYGEIHESELIVSEAAKRLIEKVNEYGQKISAYIAPSDLWSRQKDSGKSICDLFGESGIYLTKLAAGRVESWLALKEWMKPRRLPDTNDYNGKYTDEIKSKSNNEIESNHENYGNHERNSKIMEKNKGYSKMTISRKCINLIRCLPLLMHDETNLTDVSTRPHHITHAPDALRYFAVYNSTAYKESRVEKKVKLIESKSI